MIYTRLELEKLTLVELKDIGTRYDIKGRSGWKKSNRDVAIDAILGYEAVNVPVVNIDNDEKVELTREKLEKMTLSDLKNIGTKNKVSGRAKWTKHNREVAINAILGQNIVVVDDEIVEGIHEAEEKLEVEAVEDRELTRANLERMTLAELKKIGSERKINGRSKWTKKNMDVAIRAILGEKELRKKKKQGDGERKIKNIRKKIKQRREEEKEEIQADEYVVNKAQRQYNEEIQEEKEEILARMENAVIRRDVEAENDRIRRIELEKANSELELNDEEKEIIAMLEEAEEEAEEEEKEQIRKVLINFDRQKQKPVRVIPYLEPDVAKCLGIIF
jgi:hypothetical protein